MAVAACGLVVAVRPAFADGTGALRALNAGDCKRAGDEINEGIERDEPLAYLAAGTLYDGTDCVETDHRRAAGYYQRAAELGNDEARNFLGLMYGLGRGVDQDYALAYRWFSGGRSKGALPATVLADDASSPWRTAVAGYAYTVNQLARSKVRYPKASRDEGTVYVKFHSQSGELTFTTAGHGAQRETLQQPTVFVDAITDAYAYAVKVAPRTDAIERHDLVFETPWTFQRR